MYNISICLLKTFPSKSSVGWHVITRGALFNVLLESVILDICKNLTLFNSDLTEF